VAELKAALADRYALKRELGRGGMAIVYLADDLRHDRSVALKVLHPELARTLGSERFQLEIKVTARLQHPHILTVLDSGEAAGQLWFTMPFVEGESLRDRLRRERQLSVDNALRIATEASRALEYAHQHGVIHRDIKPENLLLTSDGTTLVSDFGIARALSASAERITGTGLAIGTPAYMSPEQSAGDPGLDARTDVYALGIVLYEMLVGEPPYTGATAQAMIAKRLGGNVPRVRPVRPNVSETLEQAITRALALVPADRFASAAEFAQALAAPPGSGPNMTSVVTQAPGSDPSLPPPSARRRAPVALLSGLGEMALSGLGRVLGQHGHKEVPAAVATGPKRLAVLPFENLGDSADAYFADGITDAVRGKLTALPGLQVTARSSSSQYRMTSKSPQQIGKELGVQYLLTGTVRWDRAPGGASQVQVTPELIEANAAAARWQQSFDAALTGIFEMQGDIAERVARALNVALGADDRRMLGEAPTRSVAAYDAFLKGEELLGGSSVNYPATLRRAVTHYVEAVALDPAFVMPWVRLAEAYSMIYSAGYSELSGSADVAAARRAADRALALRPDGYEGHLALGFYYLYAVRDYARALEEAARGLEASPGRPDLLELGAVAEMSLGLWDSALLHCRQAQLLDPRSLTTARTLALTLAFLRRYPEALAASDHGLALAPTDLPLLRFKGLIYLAQGDLPGAQSVMRAGPRRDGVPELAFTTVMYLWALEDSDQRRLLRLSPSSFDNRREIWASALAQTHWLRGDKVQARVYADLARQEYETLLRSRHNDYTDAFRHTSLGLMWAFLAQSANAVREGENGRALLPVTKDAVYGTWVQRQLARIFLLVGETDKALDEIELLLGRPSYLSPAWLRIDPTFAELRGNPRFERLVAASPSVG
jgi:serine/threonine protein kinase/tetratricopeptide (TPR) repeat protein